MQRHRALSTGAVGSAALRGALAIAALSALFLVGLLVPGTSEGSGPFNVNGSVARLRISYDGGCTPGALDTGDPASKIGSSETISESSPKLIKLTNQGDVFGCTGSVGPNPGDDHPFALIIGTELFSGANVGTVTTEWMTPTEQPSPSLTLEVEDCISSYFPASGNIYVGAELMTYDLKSCDGVGGATDYFRITVRGVTRPGGQATTKVGHAVGSFVRAQGRLLLVARSRPRYTGGAATGPAQHNVNSAVRSPVTYLTCRVRMKQTAVAGLDEVESRSRCYAILETGYGTSPSAPYWPDDPPGGPQPIDSSMPLTGLLPTVYHDISTGTLNEVTGQMVLTTGIEGVNCFEFVAGGLWAKVTQVITVGTKQPLKVNQTPVKRTGTSRISLYTNSTCAEPASIVLGTGANVSSTELVPSRDTDGDGCSDFEELGTDEHFGGLRDPFNRWDYYDVTGDRRIDLFNDILGVIGHWNGSDPTYDRGAVLLGPGAWNKGPPDGNVDLFNDILGVIGQWNHNCYADP